jgi:hypothetical protein
VLWSCAQGRSCRWHGFSSKVSLSAPRKNDNLLETSPGYIYIYIYLILKRLCARHLVSDDLHQHFPKQVCWSTWPPVLLISVRFECTRELIFHLNIHFFWVNCMFRRIVTPRAVKTNAVVVTWIEYCGILPWDHQGIQTSILWGLLGLPDPCPQPWSCPSILLPRLKRICAIHQQFLSTRHFEW